VAVVVSVVLSIRSRAVFDQRGCRAWHKLEPGRRRVVQRPAIVATCACTRDCSACFDGFVLVRPAAHLLVAKPGDGSDVKHIGQRWRRTRTKIIASVRLQKTDLHLLTPSFSSSSSQSPAGATSIANGSEQPGGPLSHWRKARNIVLAATRLKALKNIPEVEDSYPEDRSADNSHRLSEESQRHSVRSGAHGPYQGKETLVHEAQAAQMLALQAASDSTPASGPPTVGSEQGAATDKGEFVPPEASNPRMVTLPRHYAMASLL
jgi:hypothetical protein